MKAKPKAIKFQEWKNRIFLFYFIYLFILTQLVQRLSALEKNLLFINK